MQAQGELRLYMLHDAAGFHGQQGKLIRITLIGAAQAADDDPAVVDRFAGHHQFPQAHDHFQRFGFVDPARVQIVHQEIAQVNVHAAVIHDA